MRVLQFLATATVCVLSTSASLGQAQNSSYTDKGPISIGATLSFQSGVLAAEKEILISLPPGYDSSSKRYPVIYLLDAQYFSSSSTLMA